MCAIDDKDSDSDGLAAVYEHLKGIQTQAQVSFEQQCDFVNVPLVLMDFVLSTVDENGAYCLGTATHRSGIYKFTGLLKNNNDKWEPLVGTCTYFGLVRYTGMFYTRFMHYARGEYSVWCDKRKEFVVLHTIFDKY